MDTRGLGIEIDPADDSVLCSSILLAYEKHISRDFRFSSSHNLSPQIMKTDDETSQGPNFGVPATKYWTY
jgi:hypothetical protein